MGKEMTLVEPALVDVEWPPTEDELPCDDGVPMETQRHVLQLDLLMYPLLLLWVDRQDIFVGGNMFVYFSLEQVRNRDFRGPDFFVVLGVPKREHKSWVVWQEGKGPDLVIELLSESTAALDKGEKKQIYQDQLRVPEYFWFDPFSGEWAGFALRGRVYEPIEPDAHALSPLFLQVMALHPALHLGEGQGLPLLSLRHSGNQEALAEGNDPADLAHGQPRHGGGQTIGQGIQADPDPDIARRRVQRDPIDQVLEIGPFLDLPQDPLRPFPLHHEDAVQPDLVRGGVTVQIALVEALHLIGKMRDSSQGDLAVEGLVEDPLQAPPQKSAPFQEEAQGPQEKKMTHQNNPRALFHGPIPSYDHDTSGNWN